MTISLDIIEQQENIDLDFGVDEQDNIDLDFDFDNVYTGSYEPTPSVGEQTLETANKRMLGDIKIKAIPTSVVDNIYGGQTFTIG